MAIIRLYTGPDGKSRFEDIEPVFEPRNDRSVHAAVHAKSGIVARRFEPGRSNPWHNAPGRVCVFTPLRDRVQWGTPGPRAH